MKLNRQQTKVLLLLRTAGAKGINSYDLRFKFHLIQAPVRILELKNMGFSIVSPRKSNGSVDYILISEPGHIDLWVEKVEREQQQERVKYIFNEDKGTAYQIFAPKQATQLNLL